MLDLRSIVPFGGRNKEAARTDLQDPFVSFRREMDRLFDSFFGDVPAIGEHTGAGAMMIPRLDVHEKDGTLSIDVELPGVDEKDVEVKLEGDLLTITGEKRAESEDKSEGRYLVERSYGGFTRSLRLPFTADPDSVKARFDKGVLTITMPKPAEVQDRTRRIEIKSAA